MNESGIEHIDFSDVNIQMPVEEKDKELIRLATLIRPVALEYAKNNGAKEWLFFVLRGSREVASIISEMRHVEGGQEFILEKIMKVQPDLCWSRGGTRKKMRDDYLNLDEARKYFSDEELDTNVVDGGGNGLLGEPNTAKQWLETTKRKNPVLYSLTVEDLLVGIKDKAISLISEHGYDLCVTAKDMHKKEYIKFCGERLKIREVVMEK